MNPIGVLGAVVVTVCVVAGGYYIIVMKKTHRRSLSSRLSTPQKSAARANKSAARAEHASRAAERSAARAKQIEKEAEDNGGAVISNALNMVKSAQKEMCKDPEFASKKLVEASDLINVTAKKIAAVKILAGSAIEEAEAAGLNNEATQNQARATNALSQISQSIAALSTQQPSDGSEASGACAF